MARKQHHGGAWKIAYADFMTAMMALFLLFWLLSLSEEDKLTGIANYFKPSDVVLTNIGGQGVMGGTSSAEDDFLGESVPASESSDSEEQDLTPPGDGEDAGEGSEAGGAATAQSGAGEENPWSKLVENEADASPSGSVIPALQDIEERLSPFAETVRVYERSGNVVIDVLDLSQSPTFVSGSAQLTGNNEALAAEIASILTSMGGTIIITGHTDSSQYSGDDGYGNWELSADRANAVRRAMIANGVVAERIIRVSGVADTDPISGTDPAAAENRRVSIEVVSGA